MVSYQQINLKLYLPAIKEKRKYYKLKTKFTYINKFTIKKYKNILSKNPSISCESSDFLGSKF